MGRGPSYPYVGLEEAIALTRKTYDYTKRATAPVESIVTEAWKYSPSSSGSQKVLAALRAYGLVEDAPGTQGKSIKLTPRAIRILLDEEDSQERKEEIRKAALAPKWYEYCWRTWGKEMPASMRSNLLIEHGFVDTTVEGFLKDYRRTIAFAGLLDDVVLGKNENGILESQDSFKPDDWVQWESQGVLRMPAAKKLTHYSPDGKFAFVEGEPTGIPAGELIAAEPPETNELLKPQNIFTVPAIKPSALEGMKMHNDVIASGGITLQIQWPIELSQEAYDDLIDYLAILQKRAKRAIKPKENTESEVPSKSES